MRHALVEAATDEQLMAAKEAADWLLDAIATSTQDRSFLRGEDVYDHLNGEAIMACGIVACLRAINKLEGSK